MSRKINIKVSTRYVGSEVEETIEFEDWELEGKTEEEIELYINNECLEYMIENMLDWTWWEEGEE